MQITEYFNGEKFEFEGNVIKEENNYTELEYYRKGTRVDEIVNELISANELKTNHRTYFKQIIRIYK